MADTHVISALTKKRSEAAGIIAHHRKEIERLSEELRVIDSVIKLFEPDFDFRKVRTKEYRERNLFLKQGEATRMVLDVLRGSEVAMTSRQIAEHLLQRKSVEHNARNVEALQNSTLNVLKRLENKGLIIQSDKVGAARTWRIA